jgi:hypothetical protein
MILVTTLPATINVALLASLLAARLLNLSVKYIPQQHQCVSLRKRYPPGRPILLASASNFCARWSPVSADWRS